MGINYTANIQGPDPRVTQQGWRSLSDLIMQGREQQRLRESAQAQFLLQRDQRESQVAQWGAENARANAENDRQNKELLVKQEKEKRDAEKAKADAANMLEDRKRAQSAAFAEAHTKAAAAAKTGDMSLAHSYLDAVGAKPVVDTASQVDQFATAESGAPSTAPVRFQGPDGQQVSVDPQAAVQQREEAARREKVSKVFAQYKGMEKSDPRVAQIMDYTMRRIGAPGTDTDKALDDMGTQIGHLYGVDASERNARRHASAAAGAKAPGTTIEAVANLDAARVAVDEVKQTLKDDPDSWNRYIKNDESWQRKEIGSSGGIVDQIIGAPRRIGQVVGIADIAPEQGLKGDPNAIKVHRGMERIFTATAKGYGGVITASDIQRSKSEAATLGMTGEQAIEYVQQKIDDLARKRGFYSSTGRGNFDAPAQDKNRTRAETLRNGGRSGSTVDEEIDNL